MQHRVQTIKWYTILIICLVGFVSWPGIITSQARMGESQLKDLFKKIEQAYSQVTDYTCIFYKQEQVAGVLQPREEILFKFRKPFSVYMKWLEEPHKGRELLYSQGNNNGSVQVHQSNFPYLTVNIKPDGVLAMRGNRHPVTESGIGNTIDLIARDLRKALSHPSDSVWYMDTGWTDLNGSRVWCIKAIGPDSSGRYYAPIVRICIDTTKYLPVRITVRTAQGELLEDYQYQNLRINTGLTDLDFDPDNPDYHF